MNRLAQWVASWAVALALPVAGQTQPAGHRRQPHGIDGHRWLIAGTNFNNGVQLAFKEINASGGILGQRIQLVTFDTQTNAGLAKVLAQKAVALAAYAVIGPVFSGDHAGEHGCVARGPDPDVYGRGGCRDYTKRQSFHLPDVADANGGDAAGRALHEGRRAYQDRCARVDQQPVRVGGARRNHQGAGRARHQDCRGHSRGTPADGVRPCRAEAHRIEGGYGIRLPERR